MLIYFEISFSVVIKLNTYINFKCYIKVKLLQNIRKYIFTFTMISLLDLAKATMQL